MHSRAKQKIRPEQEITPASVPQSGLTWLSYLPSSLGYILFKYYQLIDDRTGIIPGVFTGPSSGLCPRLGIAALSTGVEQDRDGSLVERCGEDTEPCSGSRQELRRAGREGDLLQDTEFAMFLICIAE